jgi:hypothetical protein
MQDIDENEWHDPDASDLNPDNDKNWKKYKDFTNSHPAGKLWLQLLNGQTQINEKLGLNIMPINLDEMCTYFYNWQLGERNRMQRKIKQGTVKIEEALLEREFNAHLINQAEYTDIGATGVNGDGKMGEKKNSQPRTVNKGPFKIVLYIQSVK